MNLTTIPFSFSNFSSFSPVIDIYIKRVTKIRRNEAWKEQEIWRRDIAIYNPEASKSLLENHDVVYC